MALGIGGTVRDGVSHGYRSNLETWYRLRVSLPARLENGRWCDLAVRENDQVHVSVRTRFAAVSIREISLDREMQYARIKMVDQNSTRYYATGICQHGHSRRSHRTRVSLLEHSGSLDRVRGSLDLGLCLGFREHRGHSEIIVREDV